MPVRPLKGDRVRNSSFRQKRGRLPRPAMERLEDRTLLSGGGLDPAFGTNGVVTTDFRGFTDQANALALQSDGKIVAVGTTSANSGDFAIARYNSNGTLDASFGSGGIVTLDFGGSETGSAVALQTDGKIVVAGTTSVGSNFALARLNTNGTLDTAFGKGGLQTTDVGGTDSATSIAIQTDGKIVLGGESNSKFALVRYNTDGTVDSTYGSAGKEVIDISGNSLSNNINAILLQPDGSIVAGGDVGTKFVVARFTPIGALDTTFGTGGKTITDFPNRTNVLHSMAFQPDGSIVVAGEANDTTGGNNDFALARYFPNGVIDTSFGQGNTGTVLTDFSVVDIANAVAVQSDGKILAAGFSTPGTFRIVRYLPSGAVDTGFGINGSVNVPAGQGNAIVVQPDAKFVVGGANSGDFESARYFVGNPLGDIQFHQATFNGSEKSGIATIRVDRVNGSQGTVTVHFATSDGSATAGVQYAATSGDITFNPGETTKFFTVQILPDGMIDGTTTVNLTLSAPGGGATLGDRPNAVLDIMDAPGSLQFSNMTYSVTESAGSALITVTRAVGDGGPVTVDFSTSDGTAVSGVDYVPTSGTLLFGDGQLTSSFIVTLINNPLATGTLTVNLNLSNPTNGASLGQPSTAELDIFVSPGSFQFSTTTFSVPETAGFATILVDRVNGSDGVVSVNYSTSDGTAKAGINYLPVFGTLAFGPGETEKSFIVPVLNDGLAQGNLSVNLKLSGPQGGANLGGRSNAVLVVQDSPGVLQFGLPNNLIRESQGTAFVSVTRTVGVGGLVSVDYATVDGTAVAGTDYTAASGTLTFGPGEVAKVIPVQILDDGKVGGVNKTFSIALSNAQGGAVVGAQAQTIVTIIDNHQPGTEADFNGDGKTDLSVFRPSTGQFFIKGVGLVTLGQAGDIPVPGFYDGKDIIDPTGTITPGVHKAEAAVYEPGTGTWIINGPSGARTIQFGEANVDIPVPGDYDGDGQTDLAVYRPTTGQWFIKASTTGPEVKTLGTPNADQPVPGDYDGDGRTDIAVFNSSTATWRIQGSAGGPVKSVPIGAPNVDKPVPADYDGDGKTDVAVFRPSTDQWIIITATGTKLLSFGQANVDIPVPGDYDGDGKADLAVFRPTSDQWWVQGTTAGGSVTQFGAVNLDVPASPPIAFRATSPSDFGVTVKSFGGNLHTASLSTSPAPSSSGASRLSTLATSASGDATLRNQLASTPNTTALDQALNLLGSQSGSGKHRHHRILRASHHRHA